MTRISDYVWKLNNLGITVTSDSLDYPRINFAKHSILDSTETNLQFINKPILYRDIEFVDWDNNWPSGFKPLVGSGTYTLITDSGIGGNYLVEKAEADREYDFKSTNPVWRVTMTLRRIPPVIVTSGGYYWSVGFWDNDYWADHFWAMDFGTGGGVAGMWASGYWAATFWNSSYWYIT